MRQKRSGPSRETRAATEPPSSAPEHTVDLDRQLLGDTDALGLELRDGNRFRLAVRCRRCGRWLTGDPARANGIGRHCAGRDGGR